MAPHTTRRTLLGALGTTALAGLAGCSGLGGSQPSPSDGPTTYGFDVRNRLTESLFEHDEDLPTQPAVLHIAVKDLDPDSDRVFFEQTVRVETNSSTTVSEAFTAAPDGPTYAIDVRMERIVDRDRPQRLTASHTFAPGEYGTPDRNPIPVVVYNDTDVEMLFPAVDIRPTGAQ